MNVDFSIRPPNLPAKRASLLLLIAGGLALVIAVLAFGMGVSLPRMEQDPQVRERLEELRRQTPADLQMVLYVFGAMCGGYAVVAIGLGIAVRWATRTSLILTLSFAAIVATVAGLLALNALFRGRIGDFILPAIAVAIHLWVVRWTIEAWRVPGDAAPSLAGPTSPHRPMQAYYTPPVPPESNYGRSGS